MSARCDREEEMVAEGEASEVAASEQKTVRRDQRRIWKARSYGFKL